ncbi:hypothetical protein V5O48_007709 [Marasmius crinis-equi]|uniref:Uncharacterized protein n=1 Tax=Marasmius crinis-equi TaxID=585013 RepID=A0ABR3FG18_9AGAR
MPPKRNREKLNRQVNESAGIAAELIAKRTKKHLDELERSNYSETTLLNDGNEDDGVTSKYTKGRARQTISDKRNLNLPGNSPAASKKKSTMNVRTALLYRKNFATLLEESVRTRWFYLRSPFIDHADGNAENCFTSSFDPKLSHRSMSTANLPTSYDMLRLWLLGIV